ncbi:MULTISPECIES: PAAR domain-containing protein [Caballeronia]|jgi:uncharacterized Zn-binding protein involved in type VI secretion|uniref:PAAR repeat-containing protein n=1 Tax=Caballeronia zhejiangensis TaxID=871203 RepID=A0A656QAR1_9BURK|nr:PAAR domain-containing protein [Caballeronia zhejiangensis]KDR24940.1 hypothetical protein BG60_33180 [Caballeronia zhejiangensis]
MRKAAIREGDPTTTGGYVIAGSSTISDDRRKVALSEDQATCGSCNGAHRIHGTGLGIKEKGLCAVVEGDIVLCPCGKNRVAVGRNPGIFLRSGGDKGHALTTRAPSPADIAPSVFDELIVLRDEDGQPISHQRFRIKSADGATYEGITSDAGETVRVRTNAPLQIEIELLV